MARIKISELPELDIATLDTTYVAGVYDNTTFKIPINRLTSSLDTTFASDLVVNAVSDTINTLATTASFNALSTSVDSRLDGLESFSSSADNRYVLSGSITQTTWDNIANKPNNIVSSSTQISDLGFVTGSYTTITSFNSLTQSFNSISQSFSVISGSVGTIDFSTLATTASNTFIGNQTISGSTYISGGLDIKNNGYSWSFDSNGKTRIPNITFNSDRGTGMVGIKPVAGREFQIETSTEVSSAGPWVFGLDGTLSAPNGANILRVGNLVTTESFNSFTQSYYSASASFDSRIDGLENATSSYLTSLNGAISSSAQVLNGSGIYSSSTQLPDGLVSGSSQLTSSFDTRYALSSSISTTPTLYLLEAYANVTYTLPDSFIEDPCRYSVVNNTVNVSSSWFNTSTYTFTPQKAGYWEITAAYDVYRNSEAAMAIKKNNGIVVTAGAFGAVSQQVTKIVYLNGSTDFINVVNVGGAANSRSQYEGRSWFQARWVGE
jgi:hypothetical protein